MTSGSSLENKASIYETVTMQIVAAIEAGAGACKMPWHAGAAPVGMPVNALTEMPYHGINVVALWAQAASNRYITGYWASYQQWRKLGAQVRGGERGSSIIFYKRLERDVDESGEANEPPRLVIRMSRVFNAEQVEGWEFPLLKQPAQVEINQQIEAFVHATKADIRHGSAIACYRHQGDIIEMPSPQQFTGTPTSSPTEAYYAVLLHELIHWTGAARRIGRAFGTRFGDRDYAFEELVAELGAAFLCSAFRIVNHPRPDHAAYISHWLEILDHDHKAIFTAAGMAQTAVEYLRTIAASAVHA